MNRHTWRSLLGLDEGPGTNLSQHLSVPLPSEAMENVLETVHGMPPDHTLTCLASLLRFLLEVAQQISEVVVTNNIHADPNVIVEGDGNMMVQLSAKTTTRARLQFQALQEPWKRKEVWSATKLPDPGRSSTGTTPDYKTTSPARSSSWMRCSSPTRKTRKQNADHRMRRELPSGFVFGGSSWREPSPR